MRAIAALSALLALAGPASAAGLGVAAPLSGPFALIGAQIRDGASAAAGPLAITIADDRCSAEGGEAAAAAFVSAGVGAVVGFACTEAAEAALPVLLKAGIPLITPAVRAPHLADQRARTGFLFYRLAPRADAEAAAIVRLLKPTFEAAPFALLDDGAPGNRGLSETVRLGLEQTGLKPVLADTFRPGRDDQSALVDHLLRRDIATVFIAGERADIAVMAAGHAEHKAASAAVIADLAFAGGEALRAADEATPLPDGVLMVAPPDWARTGAPSALAAIAAAGASTDGYAVPAYAATEVARAALATGNPVAALAGTGFATALGPVSFDDKGDWREDRWQLFRSHDQNFEPLD